MKKLFLQIRKRLEIVFNYYHNFALKQPFLYILHYYLFTSFSKFRDNQKKEVDILFYLGNFKGWILEGIVDELINNIPSNLTYLKCYDKKEIKAARFYFIVHYQLYHELLLNGHKWILPRNCVIWFTHPNDFISLDRKSLIFSLNRAYKIISTCSQWEQMMIAKGINEKLVKTIIGGANPNFFKKANGNGKTILISTAFYQRKNPELILSFIKSAPNYEFIILGKGWSKFSKFHEFESLKNLRYIECDYNEYPTYYSIADYFLSLSNLEGGPIPLIEAMMSNLIPVVTKTGFGPDVIINGVNGIILEDDEMNPQSLLRAFEIASKLNFQNRSLAVQNYTWELFSEKVYKFILN